MDDGIYILIFLGVSGLLVLAAFFAKEFEHIAEMKGHHNSKKYFWWTFLLGVIGMLMVIALPDWSKSNESPLPKPVVSDELPDL